MEATNWSDFIGWKWDAFHLAIAAGIAGRVWHAVGGWKGLMHMGGIVGAVRALLFGTNTPTPPKP